MAPDGANTVKHLTLRWPAGVLLAALSICPAAATDAHDPRHTADTIELAGAFEATLDGTSVTVTRSELAALPGYREISARLLPQEPPTSLGVLPLSALLEAYPLAGNADGLVLETINLWESFITTEHIAAHDSQLLLYYDGKSPATGDWPAWGGDVEPLAPFYVFDADQPIPTFADAPAYGMIAATQITRIRAASTAVRYADFFALELAAPADAGRATFLKRCNSCHVGPGGAGGNVSGRPFAVLTALATHSPDYFRKLVANPKAFYPDTSMPKHADFRETDFDALIAFLRAAGAR